MTQTSTYDRIMHTVGLLALGLLGMQSSPDIYKHFPWWVIMGASLVAFVVQSSTMPMTARPDTIIKAARSAGGTMLPVLFLAGALLGFTGCPPAVTPGVAPTPVQTFDECSSKVVEGKAAALIGLVAQATLGGDFMGALTALGVQYGLPEIRCAARLFADTMKRRASIDETAALQRERALMWLARAPDGGT